MTTDCKILKACKFGGPRQKEFEPLYVPSMVGLLIDLLMLEYFHQVQAQPELLVIELETSTNSSLDLNLNINKP